MGKMQRSIKNTYYTARRGPDLPPWTKILPILGLVGFVIYIGASLFSGGSGQPATTAAPVSVTGPTVPIGSATTSSTSPTSGSSTTVPSVTTTTPDGEFVALPGPGGLLVNAPSEAVAAARATAVALFTGDFLEVPKAPNAVIPTIPTVWDDPLVGGPTIDNIGEDTITFSFDTDPDRDGPEPARTVTVTVAHTEEDTWVWLGV